jgi:hypothetical protein
VQENERLKEENKRLKAEIPQPDDEELKQRCLALSAELFKFLDKRDDLNNPRTKAQLMGLSPFEEDPEKREQAQEATAYHKQTRRLYSEQYAGKVRELFKDVD